MRRQSFICAMVLLLGACSLSTLPAFSQADKIGVQVVGGTQGIGGQVAYQVLKRANIRGGFSAYNFSHSFDKDGITYDATLKVGSAAVNFDWYLLGPLHVSPGLLLFNRFRGEANASAAAGQRFTLGDITYQSGAGNPLNGNLTLSPRRVAPELLIGLGNLVPRSGRHLTANLDLGVVFQGSPDAALSLKGLACPILPNGTVGPCVNAGTDTTVQSNVTSQQDKLNNDLKAFKYYPVISFGIGWKF